MASGSCQNHLGLAAVGVCMRCQLQLCGECITKLDGVNHCHRCVRALATPETTQSRGALPSWFSLLLGLSVLWLLVWSTLEALFPGATP